MSGPARRRDARDDPALDPGVLADLPLAEFNGFAAVLRHGGCAVLPWRGDHLAAAGSGCATVPSGLDLPEGGFAQALVRIQKGRAATCADLISAWRALRPDGRLLVTGGNDLGIASWCRRLAGECGSAAEVLANHSRARVAAVRRPGTCPPAWTAGSIATGTPGVFSGGGLDAGTGALIAALATLPPAKRVLDLGCGAGHLGLAALARWPGARAWLVDADARAVAAAEAALLAARSAGGAAPAATVAWWDIGEALPATGFDLVLCNPPCHAGSAVDLEVARAMFRIADGALVPGGRLLVVANRQLPYEADLAALGRVAVVEQAGGFKVLALIRA